MPWSRPLQYAGTGYRNMRDAYQLARFLGIPTSQILAAGAGTAYYKARQYLGKRMRGAQQSLHHPDTPYKVARYAMGTQGGGFGRHWSPHSSAMVPYESSYIPSQHSYIHYRKRAGGQRRRSRPGWRGGGRRWSRWRRY